MDHQGRQLLFDEAIDSFEAFIFFYLCENGLFFLKKLSGEEEDRFETNNNKNTHNKTHGQKEETLKCFCLPTIHLLMKMNGQSADRDDGKEVVGPHIYW